MSYILDALKKLERERRLAKVPTLDTAHRTSSAPRRRLWPWIGAAVVLVNAVVLIWLLRPVSMPFIKRSAVSTSTPAAPAVVSGQPAPAPQPERTPAGVSGQRAVPPPADRAPRVSHPEKPAAVATAPPEPAPSSKDASASRRPQPTRTPATTTKRVEATPGPSVALTPAAPKAEPRQPKPAGAPAPPTAPAALEKPAASTPAPPVPPMAAAPDKPAATPVAPGSTKPSERGTGSLAALQDMPLAIQEVIQNMKIQALVYSDEPAERLVFINSQKYREGQPISGTVVVERITPDGVILSHEGKRFLRRQY
jgi:general secretion pathway protein B